jgi:ribosomal protein L11 methylase PrmA
MGNKPGHHPASFRDPDGFLFQVKEGLYRQVNLSYQPHYDRLVQSGLLEQLTQTKKIVASPVVDCPPAETDLAYLVLQPERIPFISYPYEWCFSQLKDAALLTLDLQKTALEKGLILKDASAYNIQFTGSHPLLIDSLSFEIYKEGSPWAAYRQFCQHFLAPLALMAKTDIRLGNLLRVYIDGIPLDLAASLLPFSTRLNPGLLAHIHLHASAQKTATSKPQQPKGTQAGFNKMAMLGLVDSLESTVRGLQWEAGGTPWADYYDSTNYSAQAFEAKKQMIAGFLEKIQPVSVWDLGSNTGVFSRLASQAGIRTVSFDLDPAAVEQNYLQAKKEKSKTLLPLVLDLTNPSPGTGWNGKERSSIFERGPADVVMALALIHHLAISNNVPLPLLAEFFAGLGRWLIIEFVPKEDSQVQRLLSSRKDIFTDYTESGFLDAFRGHFNIIACEPVAGSARKIFFMEKYTP